MSNKLNILDSISVRSFKKKNICSFTEQLLFDVNKLVLFFHKISYLRLINNKFRLSILSIYISNLNIKWFWYINKLFFFKYYLFFFNNCYIYLRFCFISSNPSALFFCYFFYIFSLCFLFYFYSITSSFGVASLPTKMHKFTILRSPHIDKNSREQFESRVYKRLFSINPIFSSFFYYLCYASYNYFLCNFVHTFFYCHEEFI